jgi:hypothetical protein
MFGPQRHHLPWQCPNSSYFMSAILIAQATKKVFQKYDKSLSLYPIAFNAVMHPLLKPLQPDS